MPWLGRPEVIAICGIRRCGKSTLMRQLVRTLVERGVAAKDTLFVNFVILVAVRDRIDGIQPLLPKLLDALDTAKSRGSGRGPRQESASSS